MKNLSEKILSLLCVALLLAGCSQIRHGAEVLSEKMAWQTPMPEQCQGWEKIALGQKTRYLLLRKDAAALINIDAHNLRGKKIGCWQ